MVGHELGLSVGVVVSDVLFEALKARMNLNLTRFDVVQLAVLENVGGRAWVARKLLRPEIGSDAEIGIVAPRNHHFACVSNARHWVRSHFSC